MEKMMEALKGAWGILVEQLKKVIPAEVLSLLSQLFPEKL